MRDSEGKIIVYIGQPWIDPIGILVKEDGVNLLIETLSGVVLSIENTIYKVSPLSYEEYKIWRKDFSGIPKKEKIHPEEHYDRFDIMEIE